MRERDEGRQRKEQAAASEQGGEREREKHREGGIENPTGLQCPSPAGEVGEGVVGRVGGKKRLYYYQNTHTLSARIV